MNFETHSHRNAEVILKYKFENLYHEFIKVIQEALIDEENLIKLSEQFFLENPSRVSPTEIYNNVIREKFLRKEWTVEPWIFDEPDYQKIITTGRHKGKKETPWRMDFAKQDVKSGKSISIEVVFNNKGYLGDILMKLDLSCRPLNALKKNIKETEVGIFMTQSQDMKTAINSDSTTIVIKDVTRKLRAYHDTIISPIFVIALPAPTSFKIERKTPAKWKKEGIYLEAEEKFRAQEKEGGKVDIKGVTKVIRL